jgi:nitrite reductase (cytochrome c-552)
VSVIQARTARLRNLAMDALMALIADLKSARVAGASDGALAPARDLHRKAQFFLDFVEAENSMGFHAPGEALRILGLAIDYARQGQLLLHKRSP